MHLAIIEVLLVSSIWPSDSETTPKKRKQSFIAINKFIQHNLKHMIYKWFMGILGGLPVINIVSKFNTLN